MLALKTEAQTIYKILSFQVLNNPVQDLRFWADLNLFISYVAFPKRKATRKRSQHISSATEMPVFRSVRTKATFV